MNNYRIVSYSNGSSASPTWWVPQRRFLLFFWVRIEPNAAYFSHGLAYDACARHYAQSSANLHNIHEFKIPPPWTPNP